MKYIKRMGKAVKVITVYQLKMLFITHYRNQLMHNNNSLIYHIIYQENNHPYHAQWYGKAC